MSQQVKKEVFRKEYKVIIETPKHIDVYFDGEEKASQEECEEFAKEWHSAVINAALSLKKRVDQGEYIEDFTEFYNEDGEIPEFNLEVKY